MRSLACLVALFAVIATSSMSGCLPDDSEPGYPVMPISGPPLANGTTEGDNSGGGLEPNVPTGDAGVGGDGGFTTTDGGFVQDAGPFLDAFDFPMDAPEPSNPGGDQIP